MKCPKCQGDTYVTETRTVGEGALRRRRTCCGCLNKFVTLEAPEIEWKRFKVELAAQAKAGHKEVTQAAKAIVAKATAAASADKPQSSKAEREKAIAAAAERIKRQKVREMDKLPEFDDGYDDSLRDFINVRGDADEWN